MATGTGNIWDFLLKEGIGGEAITAVEEYGVHSYEDFMCMTEKEIDSLENVKPFEKNRLKDLQKAEKAKSASRGSGSGNVHQSGDGNVGMISNPQGATHLGHNYNQGSAVGGSARVMKNSGSAQRNVQSDHIESLNMGDS